MCFLTFIELFCTLPPFAVSLRHFCFISSWFFCTTSITLVMPCFIIIYLLFRPTLSTDSALLPRSAGCSLFSWLLRAPLQPVVPTVCPQHRALPSYHGPLWVPVRLLWLSMQPRQVTFCVPLTFPCCFTNCQIHSLWSFSLCYLIWLLCYLAFCLRIKYKNLFLNG